MKTRKEQPLAKKIIPIFFVSFFAILLLLLFCFDWVDYYLKRSLIVPNIVILIVISIVAIPIFLLYRKNKQKVLPEKLFKRLLVVMFFGCLILQIIIIYNMYFFTDWDVGVVSNLADIYLQNGKIGSSFYLTTYPNNLFLTFIIAMIRSVPFLGQHPFFLLFINIILVDLSVLMTCLTVRRIKKSNYLSLAIYIFAIPLLILSPWSSIPYSDTFAILLPITLLYIYLKPHKQWYDYLSFSAITMLGYFIKPTVIIVAIAILVVEFLHSNFKIITFKKVAFLVAGIVFAFCIKISIPKILGFEQNPNVRTINFTHYLAMGQNDDTLGVYSSDDVKFSQEHGSRDDLKKFWDRISNRSFLEQIVFFSKKTLVNFNDGSFSWGMDGIFFYDMPERTNILSGFLGNFYYNTGRWYRVFLQLEQAFWLLTLVGCIFVFEKNNSKTEQVIMLSILGIALFLTIFESRTRYLYCYAPFFIACSTLGWHKFFNKISSLKTHKIAAVASK